MGSMLDGPQTSSYGGKEKNTTLAGNQSTIIRHDHDTDQATLLYLDAAMETYCTLLST
jgi:hypothetical protein